MTEMPRRSPAEIEQDIRVIRSNIDGTLTQLQRRLSPGSLAELAIDFARDNGSAFASNAATMIGNAGRAVRDNPLPVGLICLGVGWLMAGNRGNAAAGASRAAAQPRDPNRGRLQTGGYPGAILHQDGDAAERHGATGAGDGSAHAEKAERSSISAVAKERAAQVGGKLKAAGETVAESAASAADRLTESAQRAREGAASTARAVGEYAQTHPLMAGAAMLALGAAIAALLPRTRAEDDWLGEASDRTMAAAKRAASDVVDTAGEAAAAAACEFKTEAERHGLTTERAKREVAEIAAGGSEAAIAALRTARDRIAQSAAERNAQSPDKGGRGEEPAGTSEEVSAGEPRVSGPGGSGPGA